jgi:hypothetical protein
MTAAKPPIPVPAKYYLIYQGNGGCLTTCATEHDTVIATYTRDKLFSEEPMEQKKEMTGLEALAYLNEKRGERFLETVHDVYRMGQKHIEFRSKLFPDWNKTTYPIVDWLALTFTPCPDPSKPEPVEDEIEQLYIEFAEFVDERIGAKYEPEQDLSQGDLIDMLLEFTHKNYQRKGES